ncbi:flagellar filament capping protein FliD [Massilia endophytica]|uniref:flagellar filament capping protein FliD n=1 Tax=Massilia endophytica TaxID=2899220 RepID=UPI001E36B222|nr:flagellar filament capping protein FliD [Massilia endophytica]UGQ48066.1 flagellar filament capping protein FliD [Massilia endophytica]
MSNVGNIISSMYGNSSSATSGALSPSVAAKVQQTLAGQKGTIDKLNASLTRDQTKLSGLGQLQSALALFQNIAESLSGAGLSTSATSSTKGVLTATTGASAQAGSYQLDVKQLAQSQILNSEAQLASGTDIGTGGKASIKIETAGGSSKTITLESSASSLDDIAAALKKAGVDASVVKGSAGYALQVRSASGEASSLKFSVSGDAGIKNFFNNLEQSQAAQDAVLTVDGKEVRSATNTLADTIKGVTLSLGGTGKTELTVAQDSSQIAKNVKNFVAGFNDLNTRLAALQGGALKGDNALAQVSSQLTQLVKTGVSSSALADAGITQDSTGKLVLDEKKLSAAIAADPSAVSKLFTNDGKGIADQLDKKIDGLSANGGIIKREAAQVGKELDSLLDKKEKLAATLTKQAQALAQLYTLQEQSGTGGLFGAPGGARSLFDILA